MNWIEWLATLVWDPTGRLRRDERRRDARNRRTLRKRDLVNAAAMAQIRRTQELAARLPVGPR